ncbi:MAG: hypothetical protein DRI57_10560 [Deltaproteobacteria bacterium]|nr:MAG: hypothetical protein DRI57_10560 [Deltaproteobacteria bacterium]
MPGTNIRVALNMSETFPYDTHEEMTRKFDNITDKWPGLSDRCNEVIRMWDRHLPPNSQAWERSVPVAGDEAML